MYFSYLNETYWVSTLCFYTKISTLHIHIFLWIWLPNFKNKHSFQNSNCIHYWEDIGRETIYSIWLNVNIICSCKIFSLQLYGTGAFSANMKVKTNPINCVDVIMFQVGLGCVCDNQL